MLPNNHRSGRSRSKADIESSIDPFVPSRPPNALRRRGIPSWQSGTAGPAGSAGSADSAGSVDADAVTDPRTVAAILRSAPQPVVLFDHHGVIADWSPAAERLLGYPRGEAVGRGLLALLFPARLHGALETVISSRGASWGEAARRAIEVTAVSRDGEEIPVEMTLSWAEGSELFAMHLSDSRDRGERERELAGEAARRAAMLELGRAAVGPGELGHIIARALEVAAEYAGLESCELWDVDASNGEMTLRGALGPRFGKAPRGLRVAPPPGSKLAAALRERSEPVIFGDRLLPDPIEGPRLLHNQIGPGAPGVAALVTGISGETIGVLTGVGRPGRASPGTRPSTSAR